MNLVEQIARMIDAEGAYTEWFDGTDEDAKPHPLTPRQKYFQAKYECQAIEILKLIGVMNKATIRSDLIEWEKMGWMRLGVPIDRPDLKERAEEIIAGKYAEVH